MKFELDIFSRNVSDDELQHDLKIADAKLKLQGKTLTIRSYGEIGKYSGATIQLRFGSWNEGLQRAGLDLINERKISLVDLFDNLKSVWISKGKQPTFRDLAIAPSQYTGQTYQNRFGSWNKALEEFVAFVNEEQSEIESYETEVKAQGITKRTKRDPSLSLRFLIMKRDNFRCLVCGRAQNHVAGLTLEVDHIAPWSDGGETIEENLQTLCFDCNRGKGASI